MTVKVDDGHMYGHLMQPETHKTRKKYYAVSLISACFACFFCLHIQA
jgi:hypothetical protein